MKPVGVVQLSRKREATVYYEWQGDALGSGLLMRIEVDHDRGAGGLTSEDQIRILGAVRDAVSQVKLSDS